MNDKIEQSGQAPDDALVEALREACQPDALPPLQRARIRARVRARVADEHGSRSEAGRAGWGLVPAATALVGVLVAIGVLMSSERPWVADVDPLTNDELSAAALLLGEDTILADTAGPDEGVLPADYLAISQLLGERA